MRRFARLYIGSVFCVAVCLINISCDPFDLSEEQEVYGVDTEIGVVQVSYLIRKHDREVTSPLLLCVSSDEDGVGFLRRGSKYYFTDANRHLHELKQKSIVWYDVEKETLTVLADEWNSALRLNKNEFSDYIIAVLTKAGVIEE